MNHSHAGFTPLFFLPPGPPAQAEEPVETFVGVLVPLKLEQDLKVWEKLKCLWLAEKTAPVVHRRSRREPTHPIGATGAHSKSPIFTQSMQSPRTLFLTQIKGKIVAGKMHPTAESSFCPSP